MTVIAGVREWVPAEPSRASRSVSQAEDGSTASPVSDAWLRDAVTERLPLLLAAARALMGNEADARDLTQDTAEIALRRGGALRDPAAMTAWLFKVQAREAIRLRRRIRAALHLDRMATGYSEAPSLEFVELHRALRSLSPRVRAVVVLHHMAGLSVDEIATALGTSPNTVKSQLKIGLARLREDLK